MYYLGGGLTQFQCGMSYKTRVYDLVYFRPKLSWFFWEINLAQDFIKANVVKKVRLKPFKKYFRPNKLIYLVNINYILCYYYYNIKFIIMYQNYIFVDLP